MFTVKNIVKYYLWRYFKFMPLLGAVLITSLFIVPFLGSGPIWKLYEKVMTPCLSDWWTVLLQFNNIYPTESFDDKCMPWAWFIPALTQLSFLLPIMVGLYRFMLPNRTIIRIVYAILLVLACAASGGLAYYFNVGAMPVQIFSTNVINGTDLLPTLNFDFYNKVYMLPVFHMASYFSGFGLAIIYRRFLIESQQNKVGSDITS